MLIASNPQQIAAFVVPLLVIIGWITGHDLTLFFADFEVRAERPPHCPAAAHRACVDSDTFRVGAPRQLPHPGRQVELHGRPDVGDALPRHRSCLYVLSSLPPISYLMTLTADLFVLLQSGFHNTLHLRSVNACTFYCDTSPSRRCASQMLPPPQIYPPSLFSFAAYTYPAPFPP